MSINPPTDKTNVYQMLKTNNFSCLHNVPYHSVARQNIGLE